MQQPISNQYRTTACCITESSRIENPDAADDRGAPTDTSSEPTDREIFGAETDDCSCQEMRRTSTAILVICLMWGEPV